MIPVDQQILHDPENGQYGDCQRACIASLLELHPSEVPHFFESGNDAEFFKTMNNFLRSLGLFHLQTQPVDFSLEQFMGSCPRHHMIYGKTVRDTQHAVIGLDGKIVHDPHSSRAGLLKDGRTFGFLVVA